GLLCPAPPTATPLPVAALTIKLLRMPAGRPMPGTLLLIGREERAAALVGIGTARRERTSRRQVGQRRHLTRNLLETAMGRHTGLAANDREMRDRGHQPVRVAAQRRLEQPLDIALSDLLAG